MDLASGGDPAPLFASDFGEASLTLSPDEAWMAYTSDASGRPEVYVRPYPGADTRTQVSANGGDSPVWAHNGSELFFIDDEGWMSLATYRTDPTFTVTDRQRLFSVEGRFYGESNQWRFFDVSGDDQRFLMVALHDGFDGSEESGRVIYVQNYFEELLETLGR